MTRIVLLIMVVFIGIIGIIGMNSGVEDELAAAFVQAAVEPPPEEDEDFIEAVERDFEVYFSLTDTFFDKDISVELFSSDPDAKIVYTLDSTPPNIKTSELYTKPIKIESGDKIKATTIKAVAFKDGEVTDVYTNSYITGENVFKRFTPQTYVFVLSADPYDLYDYFEGIAVAGHLRDQHIANTGHYHHDPPAPANYNWRGREGERDFYVEAYNHLGETLIHQAAAGRLAGGWSRATEPQKSWRLIARREYGRGKFNYPFFDTVYNSNGQLISRFDRLTLRNGGNDRTEAGLRDELFTRLAREAGFPDTLAFAPSAVFLNGEYYGFSWLRESYSEGYLEQKYGGIKDNYQIVENMENLSRVESDYGKKAGEDFAVNDWQYAYGLAESAAEYGTDSDFSFNNDKIFEEFCSLVDIDNLMLYYAIQVFVDNRDWPNNNMKMWKYYAEEDEEINHGFHDGKWRFLLLDTEFGYGLYGQSHFGVPTLSNVLGRGYHQGGSSRILQALFQREDMREKYANTTCDLISGPFSNSNLRDALDELEMLSLNEVNNAIRAHILYGSFFDRRDQIRSFSRGRPGEMLKQMQNVFAIPSDEMFSVSLTGGEGAWAWLNSRKIFGADESVTTEYFTHYKVPLKADFAAGYGFSAWEINGKMYHEQEMQISADMADSDGNVSVILHTERLIQGAPLYVSRLCTGSGADWIELYNPNLVAISTRDYFLSDDINNLKAWKIPNINIAPESAFIIVMRNNRSPDSLMRPQTNFSLREDETLYLSDINGNIISTVQIPLLEDGELLIRSIDGNYFIE